MAATVLKPMSPDEISRKAAKEASVLVWGLETIKRDGFNFNKVSRE